MFKRKEPTPEELEHIHTKDFFDMILPGTIKFYADRYIVGDGYRCVWAIREYPPSTEEQAILSRLADRSGVTLRILSSAGGQYGTTEDCSECHPKKQVKIRRKRCNRGDRGGEQFTGFNADDCQPEKRTRRAAALFGIY